VAVQADGRIVAAGEGRSSIKKTDSFDVVRYNPDGTLNSTFGTNGELTTTFPLGSIGNFGRIFLLLQPDGKILLAGTVNSSFELVRYSSNGSLDTTFGGTGEVNTPFTSTSGAAVCGIALESVSGNTEIVAAGNGYSSSSGLVLARYNLNGSLDTSFGSGGEVVTTSTFIPNGEIDGLAIQADGKIVVAGKEAEQPSSIPYFWVARYGTSGTLDSTFGSGGVATGALAGGAIPVVVQSDGKIVAGGGTFNSSGSPIGWALERLNSDGSLDTTFGVNGVVQGPFTVSSDRICTLAIQANGKLVGVGTHNLAGFSLARYNSDGSLDTTFGTGGEATTTINSSGTSQAVALQADGRIIAAGSAPSSTTNGNSTFALARYWGDPVASPSFSVTGYPLSTTAGVSGSITVTADDASGHLNPNYTGTVHFTSSDPQAVLPVDYTFTAADQGMHTFNVTLKTAGVQSITVVDTLSGMSGSETNITVNPAAASSFAVSGFPTTITQGTAGTFTVTAVDAYGNVATGYTGTVTFSSSDPLASLPANYTFTAADAGVHTFSATLNTVGTESLTATDTLNASITGIETGISVQKKHGH
jgi:uncharacterized delta-60 repeat protein